MPPPSGGYRAKRREHWEAKAQHQSVKVAKAPGVRNTHNRGNDLPGANNPQSSTPRRCPIASICRSNGRRNAMLSVSSKVRLFSCAELTPFLGHSDLIVEVKLSVSWNGDGGANA